MTNSAGVTTDYIYDGSMLVREMQVAGTNNFPNVAAGTLVDTATYLQGPTGPSYRRNDITGIPSWYVYNGLGSVVGEVDPAGNYTASGEYDVYGAPRASTQSGTFDTRQRYVGQLGHQTDPETGGLIYMQARYYDPGMGRFISEDPKGQGDNWYLYCADDPASHVDTNGKQISLPTLTPIGLIWLLISVLADQGVFGPIWQRRISDVNWLTTGLMAFGGGVLIACEAATLGLCLLGVAGVIIGGAIAMYFLLDLCLGPEKGPVFGPGSEEPATLL
jgi:RHS repeat-associated protein